MHECPVCHFRFETAEALRRHRETATGTCAYPLYTTGGFYFRTCKCTHYTPREDK